MRINIVYICKLHKYVEITCVLTSAQNYLLCDCPRNIIRCCHGQPELVNIQ